MPQSSDVYAQRVAVRLLLSGGSHRATLGSIGAIAYFIWSESNEPVLLDDGQIADRWSNVDEVVSVSGGSLLNAALASANPQTSDETMDQLGVIRARLARDQLRPQRTPRRLAVAAAGVLLAATATWLVLAALGIVGPGVLSTAPWSLVVGVCVFPVTIGIGRRLLARYLRDVIEVVTAGASVALSDVHSERRHTICSSGLASGLPYYFTVGGETPFEPAYGTAIVDGYSLADAAAASMALPGLGRVRGPKHLRAEVLVDGGVSGGFGEQVTTTLERRPEDTWRSDGDWFAVDAVRHLMSNSRIAQLVQSTSMTLLLSRWLKVSLEATYVNDLLDLQPGQYARVWSPNVLPASKRSTKSTFRDGSTSNRSEPPPNPDRERLAELQARVAEMGLFSLNAATVDLGIVVGFVSTLEVRRGFTPTITLDALTWLDEQFSAEGQLIEVWTGPRSDDVRNDSTRASELD